LAQNHDFETPPAAMTAREDPGSVKTPPLPKHWPATVKSAVLQVISLAQYAAAYTRGWAANSPNARVRLKAEKDRSEAELEQTREEMRIKDTRMASIDPHRRPNYPPAERMAILALKTPAAGPWNKPPSDSSSPPQRSPRG